MLRDRRYHSRLPVHEDQSSAVLRAGRRQFVVRLANVSAYGFGVICPPELNPRRGDKLVVGTSAGWVEVEVIRIQEDANDTILGLARIRDLENPDASCFDVVGGRAAALFAVVALVAGLILGAAMIADSKHPWRRIQTEFNRLVSINR